MLQQGDIAKCNLSMSAKDCIVDNFDEKFNNDPAQLFMQNFEIAESNVDTSCLTKKRIIEISSSGSPILRNVLCNDLEAKITNNKTLILENNVISIQNSIEHSEEIFYDLEEELEEDLSDPNISGVNKIQDKPVVCRARASLPVKFLFIQSINEKSGIYGVFAKEDLPKKTLFGPMEGVVSSAITDDKNSEIKLLLDYDGTLKRLDVSNNFLSNWMRYVRPAKYLDEQNLILYQNGRHLYFQTIKPIKAKEELKVWYSKSYAKSRNLPLLNNKMNRNDQINEDLVDCLISSWYCTHCRVSFNSASLLHSHELTHAADNLEAGDDKALSPNSKKFIETENKFLCNICKKAFMTSSCLESHIKLIHFRNIYECPLCKIKFFKLLNMRKHIPTHNIDGLYTCPHCSKKFRAYKLIRNHIRTYHGARKFICNECSKGFRTSDKLRIHMLSHSEIRQFLCANCGRQFKRKDKLSEHMKKFHLPGHEKTMAKRKKIIKNITPQKEDPQVEYNLFVYKCHICVIGFKRRGMLVNHMFKKHPEITPESVPELNLPILKANTDFFCQYCDKIYKSNSKRKAHILKYHPGMQLPLGLRNASKLNQDHEIDGTYSQTVGSITANPQNCEWCHRQYASKAKLLQHQRKLHNEMLPKSLQIPRKRPSIVPYEDEMDSVNNVDKVADPDILLFQEPLDSHIAGIIELGFSGHQF